MSFRTSAVRDEGISCHCLPRPGRWLPAWPRPGAFAKFSSRPECPLCHLASSGRPTPSSVTPSQRRSPAEWLAHDRDGTPGLEHNEVLVRTPYMDASAIGPGMKCVHPRYVKGIMDNRLDLGMSDVHDSRKAE